MISTHLKNQAETSYPTQSLNEDGESPREGHDADKDHTRICPAERITVNSPYFIKAKRQGRRQKRGLNNSGAHIGLKVLSFMGRVSPGL